MRGGCINNTNTHTYTHKWRLLQWLACEYEIYGILNSATTTYILTSNSVVKDIEEWRFPSKIYTGRHKYKKLLSSLVSYCLVLVCVSITNLSLKVIILEQLR